GRNRWSLAGFLYAGRRGRGGLGGHGHWSCSGRRLVSLPGRYRRQQRAAAVGGDLSSAEPEVPATGRAAEVTLNDVVRFTLMYPDGAHDAEGFMVDPLTGDFYLVTKREWQNLL